MYNSVATWVIVLVIGALILLMSELGFRIGKNEKVSPTADRPTGVVQAAAFTLVGLLIAFSFSIALSRYDARRAVTLREANSIGTTVLRTDLLDAQSAVRERNLLRQYVAARIAFAAGGTNPSARAQKDDRSTALQRDMWTNAVRAARRDPRSTTIPLFVESLNETIDLSDEQASILSANIPALVLGVLVLIALVAAVMMGFGFGRQNERGLVSSIMFAVMLALAIGVTLDLDRPQRGFIRVSLAPLTAVARSLGPAEGVSRSARKSSAEHRTLKESRPL